MVDSSSTVALAPWVEILQPIVTTVVTALIGAAVTYGAYLLQKWTGIKVSQDNQAALEKAVSTQAGLAIAKSATSLAGQSIDARSTSVAEGANYIGKNLKPLLEATGKTPDDVAHDIAAEIGKLTAAPPVVSPLIVTKGDQK
jgi:cytochrome bd-type quinol oxidase subunit 2